MSRTDIVELIARLNEAWPAGRIDELRPLFHGDAVLAVPGSTKRLEGRDACVQTYGHFLAQARVHAFEPGEARIDIIGDVAVAECPYTMVYELEGRQWRSQGRDLLVLRRDRERWRIAWRTLFTEPEEDVEA